MFSLLLFAFALNKNKMHRRLVGVSMHVYDVCFPYVVVAIYVYAAETEAEGCSNSIESN